MVMNVDGVSSASIRRAERPTFYITRLPGSRQLVALGMDGHCLETFTRRPVRAAAKSPDFVMVSSPPITVLLQCDL